MPVIAASLRTADHALVIETGDSDLEAFLRAEIAAAENTAGALQLPRYHSSESIDGVSFSKHHPGDFVSVDDPRYATALAHALCFLGEHIPSRRFQGKILHAFVDRK